MSMDTYVKNVIEKVAIADDSDTLRISDILAQNVLFYGALLQREQGAIQFNLLLDLVGVQDADVLQIALERVEQYIRVVGESNRQNPPFVFSEGLMDAIHAQFYGENSWYKLDQKLPHSDLTGEELIFMINNFKEENPAREVANIFREIFGLNILSTDYDDMFILDGENPDADDDMFILAVMDDHSTLTQDRYYQFLIHFIDIIYTVDGSPRTLMICPSATGNIRDDINKSRGIYAMWDLSLVRLLHLMNELTQEERKAVYHDLSLLFAPGIKSSYCYVEGHVIRNIKEKAAKS